MAQAFIFGCGGAERPGKAPASSATRPSSSSEIGPARFALTIEYGASLEEEDGGEAEAEAISAISSGGFGLAGGVRVELDAGVVVAARGGPPLRGFGRLPPRLGGGFVFWSGAATYRAEDFLAPLVKVADVAAVGGVRPWFSELLLRTEAGLFAVDWRAGAPRRIASPDFFDGAAVDAKRAVRIDALGRASFTVDAGAGWKPVPGLGFPASISERRGSDGVSEAWLRDPTGRGARLRTASRAPEIGAFAPLGAPAAKRTLVRRAGVSASPGGELARGRLADPSLGDAVRAGAVLPGGRTVAMRAGTLRIFGALSGRPVLASPVSGAGACRPLAGPLGVELACASAGSAHLLRLDEAWASATLEAVFPGAPGFASGEGGALAALGACGPEDPEPSDLGAAAETSGRAPGEPPGPARVCVRASDRWLEHALDEAETRALYRWVPGPGGRVTALLFAEEDLVDARLAAPSRTHASPGPRRGLKILRLPRGAGLLRGALWPSPQAADGGVNADFWLEPSGAVGGWMLLPPAGRAGISASRPPAAAGRDALVGAVEQGMAAAVRIAPDGRVRVLPNPEGVVEVLRGGRHALAFTENDAMFETWDGGATWRRAEAPPVPRLKGAAGSAGACSPAGCALGGGLLRLGWGGSAPDEAAAPPPRPEPPPASGPAPVALRCAPAGGPSEPARRASLRGAAAVFSGDGAWVPLPRAARGADRGEGPRAEPQRSAILPPDAPRALPVLGAEGPGEEVRTALLDGPALFVPVAPARLAIAPCAPGLLAVAARVEAALTLALLAPERGGLVFLGLGGVSVEPVAHFAPPSGPAPPSLTLGVRLGPGRPALALVGHVDASGDVFAADLDLARAAAGPLAPLAALRELYPASADACQARRPTHRFVAPVTALVDAPAVPELAAGGGSGPFSGRALVEADASLACVVALDLSLAGGALELSVRFLPERAVLRAPRGERSPRPLACAWVPPG